MSNNFASANTVINEIVKAADFDFAHDQAINNAALGIQAIMTDDGEKDFIIGGKVKPYLSGGMNFIISPIYGHCAYSGVDFIEALTSQPTSIENASPVHDRIDTVQVRGKVVPYDFQDRKFRDPTTGTESIENIPTKKRIIMEVSVKKGFDGSVTAPSADAGYIKLAEIVVPAAATSINTDNIKNITARLAGAENSNWTIDKARTFNSGYVSEIVAALLANHEENGSHKDNIIKAANILFGNNNGAVNALMIPLGESMQTNTDLSALSSVTEALFALGLGIKNAYPYVNNLLGRYTYTQDLPAAASTENVNIIAGGEAVIDGITCTVGQMVFLKNQADKKQNGFWMVQPGAWDRYPGYTNANTGCFDHKLVLVKAGETNAGKVFYLENDTYVVNTDPLDFKESILSPLDLPGKVPIRDENGRTADDDKIAAALTEIGSIVVNTGGGESSNHADQVDGVGRNLLEVLDVTTIPAAMAEIRRRCNNNEEIDDTGIPDFRGIMIGDYIDGLDLSGIVAPTSGTAPTAWNDTYKNNRIVVSGFNTYKNAGVTENAKNHILFTFRNVIAKGRINSSNTNTDGYVASEIRQWLEGSGGDGSGAFAVGLKAALGGNYLYTLNLYRSKKGSSEYKNFTVWLPTELEVFGYQTYGDEANQHNINVQFPIYQKSTVHRIKWLNGVRESYWESTPSAASTTHFCSVYYTGHANNNNASNVHGVSPAFCVA